MAHKFILNVLCTGVQVLVTGTLNTVICQLSEEGMPENTSVIHFILNVLFALVVNLKCCFVVAGKLRFV